MAEIRELDCSFWCSPLAACVAAHLGAASAQYGGSSSGAAGTGLTDGAGYLLGVAAAVLAVAAFVWT